MQRTFQVFLHASRNCRKFVYCSWAIRVNHAAEHICCVVILNPFQESYLLRKANNLIQESPVGGRAEMNQDEVASPKTTVCPMRHQFTLHIICINFQVVFFADNFRECAFHEEIFKLHYFIQSRKEYFLKETRL